MDHDDFGDLKVDEEVTIKCDGNIDVVVKMSTKFLEILTKHYNLSGVSELTQSHVSEFVKNVLKEQLEKLDNECT